MLNFILNEKTVRTKESPGLVLLDFVREVSGLTGTKDACREGECGACTVLVGRLENDGTMRYRACASCLLPLGDVDGCHVVTVEGISGNDLTLVQQLMVDCSASQCGFCTPGIVLSLTGFCLASPTLSNEDAIDALDGNICRCTGYVAIRNAATALVEKLADIDTDPALRLPGLVKAGVVPEYFASVPARLEQLMRASDSQAADGVDVTQQAGEPPCAETSAHKGGGVHDLPHAANPSPTSSVGKPPVPVAGGTDLFVQRPDELLESPLVFLLQRRDLDYIRVDGHVMRVGAAVTIEDLRRSDLVRRHFPALPGDMLLHSSTILRNKATMTGNIVNASPIGDATIILLALDASLVIEGRDGQKRETKLDRFYLGYKKVDLRCGELVTEIVIPLLKNGAFYSFEKVSNRVTLDIAAVNTAILMERTPDGTVADLRISAGGVGPIPFVIPGLEAFLGRVLDSAAVNGIVQAAEGAAKPIDDIRGSATYKRLLLGQLVLAHLSKAEKAGVAP